ncbi:Cell division protein ZapA [Jeotgalicoccus saudimassiliensis]|uniref:Cell division protein ZapA n=1 Tax=Jeotgalicoccus saudimassiliensis TaxID=1461582 RepID=A0A078M343_9STAP|nr:cell division protein ZapA [Jeotgalicoccus saudimassiliensis]CEA00650.1 Cell division protein ZapA [Jeotgalicoccus saudimassiliensis]
MGERKTRIAVKIYNEYYTLVGTDSEEHLRKVAEEVDSNITAIASNSPGLDTTRKAVLTACNIMDDYIKLKEKYEALEKEHSALKKGN